LFFFAGGAVRTVRRQLSNIQQQERQKQRSHCDPAAPASNGENVIGVRAFFCDWLFPRYPNIFSDVEDAAVITAQRKAVAEYRRRLKRQGMIRVEVHVTKDDAALVRNVARALADPERERETRALLRERFAGSETKGLKALLASAPLEGIDLTRDCSLGRDADL
jgi:hypothetical protein